MNPGHSSTTVTDGALFSDFGSLAKLRSKADNDTDAALSEVAQQFESLFVQMVMKSMREASEATGDGGLFNSEEMKFHQGMFDQQMSLHLSQQGGIGLAPIIERQLRGPEPVQGGELKSLESDWLKAARTRVLSMAESSSVVKPVAPANFSFEIPAQKDFSPANQKEFISELWPHAQKAGLQLGVPAETLVAQAALESGWGQRMIRGADGTASFNLFGIKAQSNWQGDKIQVSTLEYRDGIAQRERANFRSYDSLAGAFDDYVAFLKEQPRYQQALNSRGNSEQFLQKLQQAGYATDPNYADKIGRVMAGDEFGAEVAKLKAHSYTRMM